MPRGVNWRSHLGLAPLTALAALKLTHGNDITCAPLRGDSAAAITGEHGGEGGVPGRSCNPQAATGLPLPVRIPSALDRELVSLRVEDPVKSQVPGLIANRTIAVKIVPSIYLDIRMPAYMGARVGSQNTSLSYT